VWYFFLRCAAAAEVMLDQLRTHCTRGVYEFGFYGGKGSDASACVFLNQAMKGDCLISADAIGLCPVSSCDADEVCIQVLSSLKDDGKPVLKHVFGNFKQWLKQEHLEHVCRLELPKTASKEARVEAHVEQGRYLSQAVDAKDLLARFTDFCHICQQPCPIYATAPPCVKVLTTAASIF
jgi:hypothetical protein